VLKGWSSPGLLKTYDQERVPGSEFSVQQAFSRLIKRVYHGKGYNFKEEIPDLRCELGFKYTEGAFVSSDSSQHDGPETEDPLDPLVQAGSRLPHVPLQGSDESMVSTLDLVKQRLVLLCVDEKSPWIDAAQSQSIPIDTHAVNATSKPIQSDRFGQVLKLSEGEALIVRPDGYIAWRAPQAATGHKDELKKALEQVFGA